MSWQHGSARLETKWGFMMASVMACQILKTPFKGQKESICKKQSRGLVFEIKIVKQIDQSKTTWKMHTRLTFLLVGVFFKATTNHRAFSHPCQDMQRRKATRKDFLSEFQMFFHAKNVCWKTSKCSNQNTFGHQKGLEPPINQPNTWSSVRWKHTRRKEKKRIAFWWVASCCHGNQAHVHLPSWCFLQNGALPVVCKATSQSAIGVLVDTVLWLSWYTGRYQCPGTLGTWCLVAGTWYLVLGTSCGFLWLWWFWFDCDWCMPDLSQVLCYIFSSRDTAINIPFWCCHTSGCWWQHNGFSGGHFYSVQKVHQFLTKLSGLSRLGKEGCRNLACIVSSGTLFKFILVPQIRIWKKNLDSLVGGYILYLIASASWGKEHVSADTSR